MAKYKRNKPSKKSKTKIMTFIGEDFWGLEIFLDENKRKWAKVDGVFHSVTHEGEPSSPIRKDIVVHEQRRL